MGFRVPDRTRAGYPLCGRRCGQTLRLREPAARAGDPLVSLGVIGGSKGFRYNPLHAPLRMPEHPRILPGMSSWVVLCVPGRKP